MLSILYRASFYSYEISFLIFAAALFYHGAVLGILTRALKLPDWGWLAHLAGALLLLCALIHFYVYHSLSPQYMLTGSANQLLLMYLLKTFSMAGVLLAGAALVIGNGLYLKRTS
ncbi:MAG: hypothetical protein HGA76_09805 [Candidatus Firestonebacteria bacterium]|nr:hypothetical protein [Candidatus Firestonebacteria bacterium]